MSVERLANAFAAVTAYSSNGAVENTAELRKDIADRIRNEDPIIMDGVRHIQIIMDAYLDGHADLEAAARELILLVALNSKDRRHGKEFLIHLTDASSEVNGDWRALVTPVEIKREPAIVIPTEQEKKVFHLPTKPRLIK